MRIIKATEPIVVDHPVFLIFGQPGIGKSTLAYSARDPLLLDCDQGAHRAANRRDTLSVNTWHDVAELTEQRDALAGYRSIPVDTVGRLLDLLAADIIDANPKYGRDGALTLQGFGVLKTRFRLWLTQLRTWGKDVILIAHQREEKDGDSTILRPDIIGASYGEVMKSTDFVGYYAMSGTKRVLDFNPTEKWVGKNPAQWKPIAVPSTDKARETLASLCDLGRSALGQISEQSSAAAQVVDDWVIAIRDYTSPDDFTRAAKELEKAPEVVRAQVRPAFRKQLDSAGVVYDKDRKAYVAAAAPIGSAEV